MKRALGIRFIGDRLAVLAAVFSLAAVFIFTSPALGFQFDKGELQGSLDTTLSAGVTYRVADPDSNLVGFQPKWDRNLLGYLNTNGRAYSENVDNGTLNYDTGFVSKTVKVTSELELNYRSFGAFIRGTGFYDFENQDGDREYIALTDSAKDLVGSDIKLLDAFLIFDFNAGDTPVTFRVGDQVVSWGESTFIQNSINTINRADVAALRLPGSEVKEALIPEGMAYLNVGVTDNTTVEALYLYDWEQTDIDPAGSYFSTNDFAGDGGSKVMLGFGEWSDKGTDLGLLGFDPDFMGVPRETTRKASNSGQFGLAMRWFAPFLNDTEFGFYYVNYHSRLPIISGRSGTQAGFGNAVAAATSIQTYQSAYATMVGMGMAPADADAAAADMARTGGEAAGAQMGADDAANSASGVLAVAKGSGLDPQYISAYITDLYSQTARYFTEYPEDIKLLGISFNTDIGATGIALQGEVSHRFDMPLQVDDVELLFAALTPLAPINQAVLYNQLRPEGAGFEEIIHGYIPRDVTQVQTTFTKILGPTLGSDAVTLAGEIGWTHVHDMPDKNELRLNGPGTFTSGTPFHYTTGLHVGKAAEPASAFADADSWGYQLVAKLTFNSVMGLVNLSPRVSWQHDVSGVSPGPGGNFLEGRKAITFGLNADYQNKWAFDISYTNYSGAGRYNLINDRDFIGANIKYSF
jgi:hypothetical protein